jgi:hypothetical protein
LASSQTLSEPDRRLAAGWAADCAEHVLPVFAAVQDPEPIRALIARARAYANGELATADEIRRRFKGGLTSGQVGSPAALAVARSAGQAVGVCHMGAHALGAAAYAVQAAALADPSEPDAREREMGWQLQRVSAELAQALRTLPAVGTDRSGPLGPGLLSTGDIGPIIRELQERFAG